jgi:hypothetical protein
MANIELPYLWYAKGRSANYAFYRRDNILMALFSPNGDRLRKGDPGIEQAHAQVHDRFENGSREKDEDDEDKKIIPGSLRHGIVELRKSPVFQANLKLSTRQTHNKAFNWLLSPPGTPKESDNPKAGNEARPKRHPGHGHRPLASMDQEAVVALRDLRYDPPEDMRGKRSRSGVFPETANQVVAALSKLSKFAAWLAEPDHWG